jgi:hypothetical protein
MRKYERREWLKRRGKQKERESLIREYELINFVETVMSKKALKKRQRLKIGPHPLNSAK